MITANNIGTSLDEAAAVRAAFVLRIPITNLLQVECHAR
jgi:hypothetical protein